MKITAKGYLMNYVPIEDDSKHVYGIVVIRHDTLCGPSRLFSRPYRQFGSVKRAMNKMFEQMNIEIVWQEGHHTNFLSVGDCI
ncbi:MAG: hypothetical protein KAS32_12065 [Candidatus Peribacteraceae bacterium]|nr:hypothetical protein [Candidatus Peribacteraceae bacterium]